MKFIKLLAAITAIHYSSLGNYLVDQDGNRVVIKGHPKMICYRPENHTLEGVFQKARGSTIWLIADKWDGRGLPDWYVEIKNPVCDLQ